MFENWVTQSDNQLSKTKCVEMISTTQKFQVYFEIYTRKWEQWWNFAKNKPTKKHFKNQCSQNRNMIYGK